MNTGALTSTVQLQKTAVVVVHGIGEQRPLDTLLGFVGDGTGIAGILDSDDPPAFVNPDPISETTYLRRITINAATMTRQTDTSGITAVRPEWPLARTVDFYEYYWAYRFRDTTWREVTSWVGALLRIRRSEVSPYVLNSAEGAEPDEPELETRSPTSTPDSSADSTPHARRNHPLLSALRGSETPRVRRWLWSAVGVLWALLLSDGLALTVPAFRTGLAARVAPPQWWVFALLGVAAVVMIALLIAAMGPLGLISLARIAIALVVLCVLVAFAATVDWATLQTSWRWAGALVSVAAVAVIGLLLRRG